MRFDLGMLNVGPGKLLGLPYGPELPALFGISHRGRNLVAPEETLPAFQLAVDDGLKVMECDIRLTLDKKWVLIHDAAINRTSNGSGDVNTYTLEQLKTYSFANGFGAYAGVQIVEVGEFFDFCVANNVVPYIEIKDYTYATSDLESLLGLAYAKGVQDALVLSSFQHQTLNDIFAVDPKIDLGFISDAFPNGTNRDLLLANRGADNDVYWIGKSSRLTVSTVSNLASYGIETHAWTVDSEASALAMFDIGVKGIITNTLDVAAIVAANNL